MTRAKAVEIAGLLDEGGKIDHKGYISDCCVWTHTIERVLALGELIYFDNDKGKMQICNWPKNWDGPKWKQEVREIIDAHEGTVIDREGKITGTLYTA